jgi:hypothetical protein
MLDEAKNKDEQELLCVLLGLIKSLGLPIREFGVNKLYSSGENVQVVTETLMSLTFCVFVKNYDNDLPVYCWNTEGACKYGRYCTFFLDANEWDIEKMKRQIREEIGEVALLDLIELNRR